MSIFSRISKSRQQAKEHNAKLAEQQKKEQAKQPYRHVPTHAASDAIASAPPSWRDSDRIRIREENHRRIAAMANQRMSMPGSMPGSMPRSGSNLSHVSFPTDVHAIPMVRVPRAQSYNGVSFSRPLSSRHGGSPVPPSPSSSSKGKEVSRPGSEMHMSMSYPKTPGESGSSNGSSSSQDDLEMAYHRAPGTQHGQSGLQPGYPGYTRQHGRSGLVPADAAVYRYKSSRRISDSSIDRIAMANVGRTRDSRPPTAMRSSGPSPSRAHSPGYNASLASSSMRQDPAMQGASRPQISSAAHTEFPSQVPSDGRQTEESEGESYGEGPPFETYPSAPPSHRHQYSADPMPRAAVPTHAPLHASSEIPYAGRNARGRHSEPCQYAEAERFDPHSPQPPHPHHEPNNAEPDSDSDVSFKSAQLAPAAEQEHVPAPTAAPPPVPTAAVKSHYVVNYLPEAEPEPEPEPKSSSKSRRLTKGSRSAKKGRWPLNKASAVAVV